MSMPSGTRRFALVVNPHAGGGQALGRGEALEQELIGRGLDTTLISTTSIEHARQAAADAAGDGRIAVGVGGDGLLRAVAGGLMAASREGRVGLAGGRAVMAIAPAGRGNDFARTLGLPSETAGVAAQLQTAQSGAIDLIDVGGEIALGNVYVGFDSASNVVANALRVNLGGFTYTYAGARVAFTLPPLEFALTIDGGEPHRFGGQGITIASSAYYGGATLVAPGADPRDGVLDVICFEQSGRAKRAAALIALLRGRHLDRPDVRRFAARREVSIILEPAMLAYADGDPIASTPLTATLLPGAIDLIGA